MVSTLLRLEIFHHGELLKEIPWDGQTLWVGRGEDCGIRLDDRAISRKHAVIRHTENGFEFEKKSKFGEAKLDGRDIDQVTLHGGECLAFGDYEIRVKKLQDVAKTIVKNGVDAAVPVHEADGRMDLPETPGMEPFQSDLGSDFQPPAQGVQVEEVPEEGGATAILDASQERAAVEFLNEAQASVAAGLADFSENAATSAFPAVASDSAPAPEPEPEVDPPTSQFNFAAQDIDGATRVSRKDSANTKPILEFGDPDQGGRAYEMVDSEIAIGRAPNCHVILEDKKSSRKHVVILKQDKQWILKDLGSANGTQVNGNRVDEHLLASGDEIRIGDTRFKFKIVQADYESKKASFLQVPVEDLPPAPAYPAAQAAPPQQQGMIMPFESFVPGSPGVPNDSPMPIPDFSAPADDKRSPIQKGLDRFRAMPPRMQMIYGVLILVSLYFLYYEEDEVVQKAKIQPSTVQKAKAEKKDDKKKKAPGAPAFETLTPEQQAYVDSQYKISLENFKNREYDRCLLELGKIFSMVQDYKEAREVEALAREKKRQLEAQEEERKRKEQERQAQIKLQALVDQVGLLMDQKKYKEAEALFPEIELLQPENAAVANWRKLIIEENEAREKAIEDAAKLEKKRKELLAEFEAGRRAYDEKKYFEALDVFDALLTREGLTPKMVSLIKVEIRSVEDAIAAARDPLIEKGKKLEKEENYTDSYKAYLEASKIDPTDNEAPAGMNRIRGVLTSRAKGIYSEAVIAESFSDFDLAEKKYREVLEVVPVDNEYFTKATLRIKKLTALRRLSGEGEKK